MGLTGRRRGSATGVARRSPGAPGGRPGLWRVGAAAVAVVLVAEAAVWLLRPRGEAIEPARVSEGDYFTSAQLERARDYREGQWLLLGGILAVEGGVLVALALGRPRAARRGLEALARRPILGSAAAGAGLAITLSVASVPLAAIAHERAVDAGISTQGLGSWLADRGKGAGIGALLAGAGGAALIGLVRRFPTRWWVPGTVAVCAFEVVFVWLAPVVLAPVFNRFEPLAEGSPARATVLELGGRADVDIGEVYRVDASRRVTSLNAYVDGIGPTKRVVLYDNLLEGVERPALRSVVAHELAHVKHRDVLRGMAWVALVAPFALLFARELGGRLARRTGVDPRGPAALPAYALALAAAALLLGVIGNQLSRKVEAAADGFSLELTDDPGALIQLQKRLADTNLSDPDPPGAITFLLGTHPPTVERIGTAVAWERGERP